MIIILLAASPSLGPLEWSYKMVAKVCFKNRNKVSSENLRTYFIGALKEPVVIDFDAAQKLLEKKYS